MIPKVFYGILGLFGSLRLLDARDWRGGKNRRGGVDEGAEIFPKASDLRFKVLRLGI